MDAHERFSNEERANFAANALRAYWDQVEYDPEGKSYGEEGGPTFYVAMSDLITDLEHLAERAGINFDEVVAGARANQDHEAHLEFNHGDDDE